MITRKMAKDIYHMNCILEKMQLKLIEMGIQLVMYAENTISLELLFIVGISNKMELKSL